MSDWNATALRLPDEGQTVEVPNNGGCKLLYSSGLWFFPDRLMYVYYTPQYWRAVRS